MAAGFNIGVAIATHNSREQTRQCLQSVLASEGDLSLFVVVVDDGSTDGTWEMLQNDFPHVVAIRGDGNLWWTGATNLAVKKCLEVGCEYILLLNPDVIVESDTIASLLLFASKHPNAIVASLVVDYTDPQCVWWGGSKWAPISSVFPLIWSSRYIFKRGTLVDRLPSVPYETSEAHGRAVLVPRAVFEKIGLYDEINFPHYGADTDFSFRARQQGFTIWIDPNIRVRLYTKNTGLRHAETIREAWQGYWNYLTRRKNGEALRVWWRLTRKHLPLPSAVSSFVFCIGLNSWRYWIATVRCLGK